MNFLCTGFLSILIYIYIYIYICFSSTIIMTLENDELAHPNEMFDIARKLEGPVLYNFRGLQSTAGTETSSIIANSMI